MTQDIDAMLADHQLEPDPLEAAGVVAVPPEPERPRTTWPGRAEHWTPDDYAERERWVAKIYGEGRSESNVAEQLHISRSAVRHTLDKLGIRRPSGTSSRWKATQQVADRRVRVKEIFDQRGGRVTAAEISRQLDWAPSTIQDDFRELGLKPVGMANTMLDLTKAIGNAVEHLATVGQMLVDHPDLPYVVVSPEMAKEWEKQLSTVGSALRRVRKYMNQGANHDQ